MKWTAAMYDGNPEEGGAKVGEEIDVNVTIEGLRPPKIILHEDILLATKRGGDQIVLSCDGDPIWIWIFNEQEPGNVVRIRKGIIAEAHPFRRRAL